MPKQNNLTNRLLRLLLKSRFEPVQSILAAAAFVHGLWLYLPEWSRWPNASLGWTGAPRLMEVGLAALLMVSSVAVGYSLAFKQRNLRKHAEFVMFLCWSLVAMLAVFATSFSGIVWVAYVSIAFISAFTYLSVSVGDFIGTE
jgi:hypothetical protein